MTSYTQMQEYFNKFYAKFRREFADYYIEYSTNQYFLWATAVLKVASQNVGYYTSLRAALNAKTPDGYLPINLSPFYLREVPVIFSDGSNIGAAANNQPIAITKLGDMVIKTTIFLKNEYIPVYVVCDPEKMYISANAILLADMAAATEKNQPLQIFFDKYLMRLRITHNNTFTAMQAAKYSKDAYAQLQVIMDAVSNELLQLRNSPQYLIKIATSCKKGETGDQSIFGSLIDVVGALSFAYFIPVATTTIMRDVMIDDLNKKAMKLGLMEQDGENMIARDNTPGSMVTNTVKPDSNPKDYWNNDPNFKNNLPEVTVTASAKKPATKKAGSEWWILGALGTYLFLNND